MNIHMLRAFRDEMEKISTNVFVEYPGIKRSGEAALSTVQRIAKRKRDMALIAAKHSQTKVLPPGRTAIPLGTGAPS